MVTSAAVGSVLLLVGVPIALVMAIAARRARIDGTTVTASLSAAEGPWLVAALGVWGAFTQKPLDPWSAVHGVNVVIAVVALGVAGLLASILGGREPKVGTSAIGPLALWTVAAGLTYVVSNSAADELMHGSRLFERLKRGPNMGVLAAFVVATAAALLTSDAGAGEDVDEDDSDADAS
ncbi:MAG: hypothetical protein KC731_09780 [Myxococcales bacterium]|nr:hypothetical protein [Myxococcales bacterium]